MRDIKRIDKLTEKLNIYWKHYPNYRLGQLLSGLSFEACEDMNLFAIEDEEIEKEIDKKLNQLKREDAHKIVLELNKRIRKSNKK